MKKKQENENANDITEIKSDVKEIKNDIKNLIGIKSEMLVHRTIIFLILGAIVGLAFTH